MNWQILWDSLLSFVPPILVGGIFWVVMRGILRADLQKADLPLSEQPNKKAK